MTKSEILDRLSMKTGLDKRKCEKVLDAFADEVKQVLMRGEKVSLRDFMTFEITERAAREARNPKNGKMMHFPAVKSVTCRMSKSFKDAINGK